MRFIDVDDLKKDVSLVTESLGEEDITLTKKGKPVAIVKKFNASVFNDLSMEAIAELAKSDKSTATQYSAMMEVWGDPHCDVYDEAFRDDN